MPQINVQVLPAQHEFIADTTSNEIQYSGAVGGGKTRALCLKIALRASRKGARELLCRKTLSALKGTTLKTLLEGDGELPPVLPKGCYEHNKADKCIRIKGGGEILYFPLVDDGAAGMQQRAGSYNGTGVAIDEATELDEADYKMLLSRARVKVTGVPNQIYLACNPGSPSHFLAKRFAPPGSGFTKPLDGCRCISTRTLDNHFLPKSYIESLQREAGTLWYRRFVEGQWCGAEGLVYDRFDRQIHIKERPLSDFQRFVVGYDDGYTNPTAAVLIGIDGDGRLHVLAEQHRKGLLPDDRVQAVKELGQIATYECVVIDPSAADIIALCNSRGIQAIPANNDVRPGINAVSSRFALAGDGKPRITFSSACEETIRELETYQWKPGKDEPVKASDHAMDALRYAVMHIDGGVEPVVSWNYAAERRASTPSGLAFEWDTEGPGWTDLGGDL